MCQNFRIEIADMADRNIQRFQYGDNLPTANLERERRNRELLERQRRYAAQTLPPPPPNPEKIAQLNEQLNRLSEALEVEPDNGNLQRRFYDALQLLLEENAFLEYKDQSEKLYCVTTGTGVSVNVPKERAPMAPYPTEKSTALASSVRLFQLSLLGLLLGGIPTFFAAPITMWRLLAALLLQPLTYTEKVQATTMMFSSFVLFGLAIVLSLLLIIHLVS